MADTRLESHQPAGISLRGVVWGGISIVVGILLAASAAYLLWQHWSAADIGPNARSLPEISPPVLQAAPQEERAQYTAEKQKLLDTWEWIDPQQGIARIPVQEAMQILAARGGQTVPREGAK